MANLMLDDYFFVQLRQSIKVVLPLNSVKEVISLSYGEVCPIPGVAPALLGVVNQRGKLLWVLDLGDLLKIPPSVENLRSQADLTLLVLKNRINERQVGCVVAALKGVVALDSTELQALDPQNLTPTLKAFSSAIAIVEQEAVAALDINAILNNIQTENSINLVQSI